MTGCIPKPGNLIFSWLGALIITCVFMLSSAAVLAQSQSAYDQFQDYIDDELYTQAVALGPAASEEVASSPLMDANDRGGFRLAWAEALSAVGRGYEAAHRLHDYKSYEDFAVLDVELKLDLLLSLSEISFAAGETAPVEQGPDLDTWAAENAEAAADLSLDVYGPENALVIIYLQNAVTVLGAFDTTADRARHYQQQLDVARSSTKIVLPPSDEKGVRGTGSEDPQVKVYFGTDRQARFKLDQSLKKFTAKLAPLGRVRYGTVEVSISPDEERAFWHHRLVSWATLGGGGSQNYLISGPVTLMEKGAFLESLRTTLKPQSGNAVLLFVHGYSVDFEEGIKRAAQLSYDLEISEGATLFSWPANRNPKDSDKNRQMLARVETDLASFYADIASRSDIEKIHIVAHGIGASLVVNMVGKLGQSGNDAALVKLGEVVLAAPDMDEKQLTKFISSYGTLAAQTNVYATSNDDVLNLTKTFRSYRPAGLLSPGGRDIIKISSANMIDASAIATSFFSTGRDRGDEVLMADITAVLHNELAPSARCGLSSNNRARSTWKLDPQNCDAAAFTIANILVGSDGPAKGAQLAKDEEQRYRNTNNRRLEDLWREVRRHILAIAQIR